jgi:cell division control protein 12
MLDLITSTEEVHYDNYRAKHLENGEINTMKSSQLANKFKDEEELLRRKFTEQVKIEENRFRQWEARLIAERDRLNKDLEAEHTYIKELEGEVDTFASQKHRR